MRPSARRSIVLRFSLAVAGTLVLVAGGSSSRASPSSGALPRNDYLLVLPARAGPFRYVKTMQAGERHAYPAAVAAFGAAPKLRDEFLGEEVVYQERTAGFCHVTWPESGITVTVFAFSGSWPQGEDDPPAPKIRPCAAQPLATADFIALTLFGRRWHNRTGIQVGKPLLPGGRRSLRQNVPSSRWSGSDTLLLTSSLDRSGSVRSIRVEVLGRP